MIAQIDMDAVVVALRCKGIQAHVEQTGGGCATIFAGPLQIEHDRYSAVAGPGWFLGPGFSRARAEPGDFYVGPDDGGETTPLTVTTTDPHVIAGLIAAQVTGTATERTDMNVAILIGRVARPPEARELPSGQRLVAYELVVERPGQRADTVPVIWIEAPAGAASHDVDARILVIGRVRRRFFRTGAGTQSRTEVVADQVVGLDTPDAVEALRRVQTLVTDAVRL